MGSFTRRQFAGTLGAAGASLSAASYAQVAGSSDRVRMGVIGCGGMAGGHMRTLVRMRETDNVEIVRVCDVYDNRAEEASTLTGGKIVRDYRRVLDDAEVDSVLIATPEHWHAAMIIDALDAGKHVYCEKPMTRTADESRKVMEKVRQKPNLKMQIGVQGMSDNSYETAANYVRDGALGKVVQAQIDYSRNYMGDFWLYPMDEDAKPGVNLDWNAWLGPAPKRPWDPERYFRWRRYWDYSGGIASDLFVHRVTRIIKSLDLTFPMRGAGMGGKWQFAESVAEIPDTFNIMLDYPGGPTVLLVSTMANDTPIEHVLRGHKATLEFTSSGFVIRPQVMYEAQIRQVTHRKSGAEALDLHHRNLLNAIRKGEELKCPAELGYYGVVACDLGVQAFRKQQYMKWDMEKERIARA
jgi:predicted dehydrogenase